METTKNPLSESVKTFLSSLKQSLDVELYFYGSVQRMDYFPGSDIDVSIFADNMTSAVNKISHFLKVDKHKIKKTFSITHGKHNSVFGHKIFYASPDLDSPIEFSIYDKKDKDDVLQRHRAKLSIPIYISGILILFKFLFHSVGVLNLKTYKDIKAFLLSYAIGMTPDIFIPLS